MIRDFSVKGAIKRLSSITVLDLHTMPVGDLKRIQAFCTTFTIPLGEEINRRNKVNIYIKNTVLSNSPYTVTVEDSPNES